MIAGIKTAIPTAMLTDSKIRQTKPADKPVKLTDSNGLYLLIQPNGSKLWRYRYRIGGKENTFAIGSYPDISLAQARIERDQARQLVKQGIHPAQNRAAKLAEQISQNADTFASIAEDFISEKSQSGDVSIEHIQSIRSNFKRYVYPTIGPLPIRSITPQHILTCLQKCQHVPTVAVNVRSQTSAVFRKAILTLRADSDPTIHFANYFKQQNHETEHAEPMSKETLKRLVHLLDSSPNIRTLNKLAVKFLLYTFVRTVEMRRAEWQDWQPENKLLVIPKGKMKKKRTHAVPLSHQATAILEAAKQEQQNHHIFSGCFKDMMDADAVNQTLARLNIPHTGHDFRATASTYLNEMGFDERYIEMQLAHVEKNKTKAAYNHAQYLPQRREMMQAWADWIDAVAAE